MYYFDKNFLKNYFYAHSDIHVYADRDWYSIPSESDMYDDFNFYAYDLYGDQRRLKYKDIEIVKVDGAELDLDGLQKIMSDQRATGDGGGEEGGTTPPEGGAESGGGEEDDLSANLEKLGNIGSEEGGAAAPEGGAETPPAEGEATPPEEEKKKESRDINGNLIYEGSLIRIVDNNSEHKNSKAVVYRIGKNYLTYIVSTSENVKHIGRKITEDINIKVRKIV